MMDRINESALRIINVMRSQMQFNVNEDDIIANPVLGSIDTHVRIDISRAGYYYEYFTNICKHMQFLTALGDSDGAYFVLENMRTNLAEAINNTVRGAGQVILDFPQLKECLPKDLGNDFLKLML